MFLTPYLFHSLAHGFSAFLGVFSSHGLREFFVPFFRPRCALAFGVILDYLIRAIKEVEGELHITGNGNILDLFFEGFCIVFCKAHHRSGYILEPVFSNASGNAVAGSRAAPIMHLAATGRFAGLRISSKGAAAVFAADSGGKFRVSTITVVGHVVLDPLTLAVFMFIRPAIFLGCVPGVCSEMG